jgi:hypothetical protein
MRGFFMEYAYAYHLTGMLLKNISTLLLLLFANGLYSQPRVDAITLDKTEFPVNEFIQYKVTTAKPYRFQLDGGCSSSVLAYRIYKVEKDSIHLYSDHSRVQMDCGMPYTELDTLRISAIREAIKKPGSYIIAIPFNGGELRSAVFKIVPFKGGKYYGLLDMREPSINFPGELHYNQISVMLDMKPNGTYYYNYGSLLSEEGTYTVYTDSIAFKPTKSVIPNMSNPNILLRGSYSYHFNSGSIMLARNLANDNYYHYSLMPVKK